MGMRVKVEVKINEYGDGDKWIADGVVVKSHRLSDRVIIRRGDSDEFVVVSADILDAVKRCSP